MILRLLTLRVRAGREAAFLEQADQVSAWAKTIPGLRYVRVARRVEPDGSQLALFVTEWQDAASLYAWNEHPETIGRGPLNDGSDPHWDDAQVTLWEVMDAPLRQAIERWGASLVPPEAQRASTEPRN